MFERFTPDARAAVLRAIAEAAAEPAPEVRPTHLLTALAEAPDLKDVFARLSWPQVQADLALAQRRGGLSDVDVDALSGLGIELDVVLDRAEAELGAGVLDAGARSATARWRRHQRPAVSDEVKAALSAALTQASLRRDRSLGPEHLLLGLLNADRLVADVLASQGVDLAVVLAVLGRRERRAS